MFVGSPCILIYFIDFIHKMLIYSYASFIRYPFIRYLVALLLFVAFRRDCMRSTSSFRLFQLAWLKVRKKSTISQKLNNLRHAIELKTKTSKT